MVLPLCLICNAFAECLSKQMFCCKLLQVWKCIERQNSILKAGSRAGPKTAKALRGHQSIQINRKQHGVDMKIEIFLLWLWYIVLPIVRFRRLTVESTVAPLPFCLITGTQVLFRKHTCFVWGQFYRTSDLHIMFTWHWQNCRLCKTSLFKNI